jgi:hypothetical protein
MKDEPELTVPMPNPQTWNALQAHILLELANGKRASFDCWGKLHIERKPVTSRGSTTPFTLFRRGLIVCDGETVFITERGITFLTETIGLSFERGHAIVKSS